MRIFIPFISLLSVLLFTSFQQPGTTIRLQSESIPFTPKEFYIAAVADKRPQPEPVAALVLMANRPAQPVDMDGGLVNSFRYFVNQGWKQNKQLRPVGLYINQCQIRETAKGNRVTGQFSFMVSFVLLGRNSDGSETHSPLTEYSGSASYTRPVGQTAVVEQVIRQALIASLRNLNNYMNRESGQNEKLASGIKVNFVDDNRITSDDTVQYNPTRKLTWADFQAEPRRGSHYAAEVFTSFAYNGKSSVKNGIIQLNLTAKAYMLKKSSWGRPDARTAYALNHEQRHFDIVKIIIERFKRKIQPDSLTLEDYNSIMQYHFLESFREMNRMQTQYDNETAHSINEANQERWNRKIDEELRSFGVIK